MKKRNTGYRQDKSAIEIADEAMNLLRNAPLHVTAAYYIGSVPFVLGFLFFWSDMSRGAFAAQRCVTASFGMAALFLWMKCWQTVFASGVLAAVRQEEDSHWSLKRIVRMCVVQCSVQPHGLIAIPIAFLAMIPFYATHAFYQNVTVIGDGTTSERKSVLERSWRQARIWPKQNHILLWLFSPWVLASAMLTAFAAAWLVMLLAPGVRETSSWLVFMLALAFMFQLSLPLSPFGSIVAGNTAMLLAVVPAALKSLGIEGFSSPSGMYGIMNTTFLMTVYWISYLCLDPLIKTAHVLRCFYGESQCTGEDLIVELRSIEGEHEQR
jgi:hypothetical protein